MGGFELIFGIVPVVVIVIFIMATSVRILRDYECAVIFRFGPTGERVQPGRRWLRTGLVLLIPLHRQDVLPAQQGVVKGRVRPISFGCRERCGKIERSALTA
jgi:regulator of protease activity HflC (stomatin/prohibitin superfamily)